MAVDLSMPVLVVDDHATMVGIISKLVKSLGFSQVEGAGSAEEALTKIEATGFGLIICDWNMQPMSGLDLLRKLREDTKTRATPFVMVTAESKTDHVVAAKRAGVSNYVVKPFSAHTLKQKLEAVLGEF